MFFTKKGVIPTGHKQQNGITWAFSPVKVMPAPEKVYIPLAQHIGAPAKAVVEKGQYVKVGELIGQAQGKVSCNIHSSVSGKVLDIIKYPGITGNPTDCIVIDNDNTYESVPQQGLTNPDSQEIINAVFNAGIAGMGGAAFPTHVKLGTDVKIDYLIVNGTECEPFITADNRLMIESAHTVVQGAVYAAKAVGAPQIIIGIEANKPAAIEEMQKAAAAYENIMITVLPKRYPMGAEKQLIYRLTKLVVPSGQLPASKGCVVQNAATCSAIYYAVEKGQPLTRRIVTVAGSVAKEGANLEVAIGTRIIDVLEFLNIDPALAAKVISGGPMMGIAVANLNAPVTKGTSALLLLDEKDASIPAESPCIRCGRCAKVCPMGLVPLKIDSHLRVNDIETCEQWRVYDCMECGCCAFICPAKRQLVQSMRLAKAQVMQKRRQAK